MAINKENLKTRSITAFFFVAIMLGGYLLSEYSFYAILATVLIVGIYEWLKLYKAITLQQNKKNIAFFLMIMIGYIIVPILIYALMAQGAHLKTTQNNWRFNRLLLPVFIIACMWINDTMAYIVGSWIGKNPLSKISPKKTIEGTLGGIILCAIIAGYLAFLWDNHTLYNLNIYNWILLAFIAAIAGTFGDLLESKLKRLANLKDSGSFMPGHGGILDRFDSLLLAIPFTSLAFTILIKMN